MRYLTLVRHGEAEWRESPTADFDRPLTRRGLAEAADAAKRLRARGLPPPDLLLTSPAVRTLQTAEAIARELGIVRDRIEHIDPLYLASHATLGSVVAGTDSRIRHLLLVGHNPGISEFARQLAPGLVSGSLPTGGCVTVRCDADGGDVLRADSS
ncbi:MAG: histidine phosphatase family protein [Steroidobacteraceae bacterium]